MKRRAVIPTRQLERFRSRIHALWLEGENTAAMARLLNVPEHDCERALHTRLELKRAVRAGLAIAWNVTEREADVI